MVRGLPNFHGLECKGIPNNPNNVTTTIRMFAWWYTGDVKGDGIYSSIFSFEFVFSWWKRTGAPNWFLKGSFECAEPSSLETLSSTVTKATTNLTVSQELPAHHSNQSQPRRSGGSELQEQNAGLVHFKSWLPLMKIKGLDGSNVDHPTANDNIAAPESTSATHQLETKSLCGSPGGRYGRHVNHRQQLLADQKQQILARFGQHLPGFGFTQSKSSCLFEDDEDSDDGLTSSTGTCYSYRNGNQLEYMGGPYGYVDPLFGHQLAANHYHYHYPSVSRHNKSPMTTTLNGVRLENLDVIQRSYRHPHAAVRTTPSTAIGGCDQQPPLLSLLPTLTRSAESLVVLSKEHRNVGEFDLPAHYTTSGTGNWNLSGPFNLTSLA